MIALKKALAILISFILILCLVAVLANESLPDAEEGQDAEKLADKMLAAINIEAWKQTGAITWNFDGRQRHIWDKNRHLAQVEWGNNVIQIDINNRVGLIINDSPKITDEEGRELCFKAWKYWVNDSFWLNPIAKIRDKGTSRRIVKNNGEQTLLVTFNSGGATPGDSYQWFIDEEGLPYKWKMWVSIIPIGGISTTWENWIELSTGALVATQHKNILTLSLNGFEANHNLQGLLGEDIFHDLVNREGKILSF